MQNTYFWISERENVDTHDNIYQKSIELKSPKKNRLARTEKQWKSAHIVQSTKQWQKKQKSNVASWSALNNRGNSVELKSNHRVSEKFSIHFEVWATTNVARKQWPSEKYWNRRNLFTKFSFIHFRQFIHCIISFLVSFWCSWCKKFIAFFILFSPFSMANVANNVHWPKPNFMRQWQQRGKKNEKSWTKLVSTRTIRQREFRLPCYLYYVISETETFWRSE